MKETPLLSQYKRIKAQYKEEILLFRIGDFYETFLEDAERTSKALGITLTSKPVGKGVRVPLAGIPVKAADTYIARLLEQGFKVAICEQVKERKGLMQREVVEVITPGTITIQELLDEKTSLYIASCVEKGKSKMSVAVADITTGEFYFFTTDREEAIKHLKKMNVKEIVLQEGKNIEINLPKSYYSGIWYGYESAKQVILEHFGIATEKVFGLSEKEETEAAGLLLAYLKDRKKGKINNITSIKRFNIQKTLYIDEKTVRNLEIVERMFEKTQKGTLYWALNSLKTPMGKRFLRHNLLFPPKDIDFIRKRQVRVETLLNDGILLRSIETTLSEIGDIERRLTKVVQKKAGPKDLYLLKEDLKNGLEISRFLSSYPIFQKEFDETGISQVVSYLEETIRDNPPTEIEDFLKKGVSKELDELYELLRNTKGKLLEIEKREREKTQIPTLKIGYNQVFGYYIEVTKAHINKVPPHYIRKQTLTQSERYITEELKEFENKIQNAEEKIKEIEKEIFEEIRKKVAFYADEIKRLSEFIKEVDLSYAFSKIAGERNYTKPEITEEDVIIIKDGRHPVMELIQNEVFVPNDTLFDENTRVYIITGPNMAGKSTYLRQVALITIIAHIGSFVPARYAKIGLVDRIFSRIGASDDITRGISTFMAEMVETGEILHNATKKSLVVLDEVGRGTSTYDGMSIAFAVVKYIAQKGIKTLFATHYHELGEIASQFNSVKNYTMAIKEYNGKLYYLRKLKEGVCDKSYGLHVAEIAGLPKEVIKEAKKILKDLEKRKPIEQNYEDKKQLTLFDLLNEKERYVIKMLKDIDVDGLTPHDALNLIYKLKEELGV